MKTNKMKTNKMKTNKMKTLVLLTLLFPLFSFASPVHSEEMDRSEDRVYGLLYKNLAGLAVKNNYMSNEDREYYDNLTEPKKREIMLKKIKQELKSVMFSIKQYELYELLNTADSDDNDYNDNLAEPKKREIMLKKIKQELKSVILLIKEIADSCQYNTVSECRVALLIETIKKESGLINSDDNDYNDNLNNIVSECRTALIETIKKESGLINSDDNDYNDNLIEPKKREIMLKKIKQELKSVILSIKEYELLNIADSDDNDYYDNLREQKIYSNDNDYYDNLREQKIWWARMKRELMNGMDLIEEYERLAEENQMKRDLLEDFIVELNRIKEKNGNRGYDNREMLMWLLLEEYMVKLVEGKGRYYDSQEQTMRNLIGAFGIALDEVKEEYYDYDNQEQKIRDLIRDVMEEHQSEYNRPSWGGEPCDHHGKQRFRECNDFHH